MQLIKSTDDHTLMAFDLLDITGCINQRRESKSPVYKHTTTELASQTLSAIAPAIEALHGMTIGDYLVSNGLAYQCEGEPTDWLFTQPGVDELVQLFGLELLNL